MYEDIKKEFDQYTEPKVCPTFLKYSLHGKVKVQGKFANFEREMDFTISLFPEVVLLSFGSTAEDLNLQFYIGKDAFTFWHSYRIMEFYGATEIKIKMEEV